MLVCLTSETIGWTRQGSLRFTADLNRRIPDASAWQDEIELDMPPPLTGPLSRFGLSFLIRMVFSCVVDADFLNTEAFMDDRVRATNNDELSIIRERVWRAFSTWLEVVDSPQEEDASRADQLNYLRSRYLREAIEAGPRERGLYELSLPTGGGKTTAALGFALAHAAQHPEIRRIIYVIPYTSIIDEVADELRKLTGKQNVLEHHSVARQLSEEGEEATRWRLAAENWDAPIVVTTTVQFFESLYADRPSRCRKLHRIANSVVIIDEAQMIPQKVLKPCIAAVEELAAQYGVTAVFSTATQRPLDSVLTSSRVHSIVEVSKQEHAVFERNRVAHLGVISIEGLASRLAQHHQALVIVNSRSEARELYLLLPEDGRIHLSTYMTPHSRRRALDSIRERMQKGERCLVVATSLVECGVNLDFPVVYRALAGLDQMTQARGRCNRNAIFPPEDCFFFVFQFADAKLHKDFVRRAAIAEQLFKHYGTDFLTPEAIKQYFSRLLDWTASEPTDTFGILTALNKGRNGGVLPLRWVGQSMRLIDESTFQLLILESPEAEAIAEDLMHGKTSRQLLRRAAPWTVSLYNKDMKRLKASNAVHRVAGDLAILTDRTHYNEKIGVSY